MSTSTEPLPLMSTFEEAEALSHERDDPFFLTAYMLQCWLAQLLLDAAAEYAEKKNPRDRALQSGQAWRVFLDLFADALEEPPARKSKVENPKCPQAAQLLGCLVRFAEYDDPMAGLLRHALVPVSIEHDLSGDYIGPKNPLDVSSPGAADLIRATLARWCDWLDALVHFRTHEQWHLDPACFEPDPDKRELAVLGRLQRRFAGQPGPVQGRWLSHFSDAAARFKGSAKWPALGAAMATDAERVWNYRDADASIIGLWPLVRRHNWTYTDLLKVVRPALSRPEAYPCGREQDFASYCVVVLGLRKNGSGRTAADGRPAGYDVARRLCPAPEQKRGSA